MATTEQLAQWIVDNQDKKGAPEFEKVSNAYQLSRSIQQRSRQQMTHEAPTEKPELPWTVSEMGRGKRFLAGAGKLYSDIGQGVKQAGQQIIPAIGTSDKANITNEEVAESRERDQPLMKDPYAVGGNLTAAVSSLLPTAAIPGANTLAGSAGVGALYGAVQPTIEDESRLENTVIGAGAGSLGYGVMKGGTALVGGTKRALEPLSESGQSKIIANILRDVAGDNVDDIATRMQQAPIYVKGSIPTAGQVSGSGGIASLERAASTVNPQPYAQRLLEQNAARISAMDKLAPTGMKQAAMEMRKKATKPLINQVSRSSESVDPSKTVSLIDRMIEKNPAREQLTKALNQVKNTLYESDEVLRKNPQALKSASQNIGDLMNAKGPTGAKVNEAIVRELSVVKKSIDHQISKAEPAYGQYMQQFKELSKPINQADIIEEITKRSTTPTVDAMGNPTITPRALAQALRSGDQIAKKATGFKRAKLEKMLSPEQLEILKNVSKDLSRHQIAQNLGRGAGSNTVQNLSLSNIFGTKSGIGPPTLLSRPMMVANYLRRLFYDQADQEMQQRLLETLLNPQKAGELMRQVPPNVTPIVNALTKGSSALSTTAPFTQ